MRHKPSELFERKPAILLVLHCFFLEYIAVTKATMEGAVRLPLPTDQLNTLVNDAKDFVLSHGKFTPIFSHVVVSSVQKPTGATQWQNVDHTLAPMDLGMNYYFFLVWKHCTSLV